MIWGLGIRASGLRFGIRELGAWDLGLRGVRLLGLNLLSLQLSEGVDQCTGRSISTSNQALKAWGFRL